MNDQMQHEIQQMKQPTAQDILRMHRAVNRAKSDAIEEFFLSLGITEKTWLINDYLKNFLPYYSNAALKNAKIMQSIINDYKISINQ